MDLNGLSRSLDFVLWEAQVTNKGFLEVQLHNQIFLCKNITHFLVWRMNYSGEILEVRKLVRMLVILQTKDMGPLMDNDLHILIYDIYDIFTLLFIPLPLSAGWTLCLTLKNRMMSLPRLDYGKTVKSDAVL